MFLRVSAKEIRKSDTFLIECEGNRRPIDNFSNSASFDCGDQINCHANIEFVPKNYMMGILSKITFVIKEIITAILFFLVFDSGAWYENIDPFRIKKKITFKPSSDEVGELNFEFCNSVFNKAKGQYSFPNISVETNGVIISEEIGYLPNLDGVRLGFIHYIFQILVPSVILLALCAYGIVSGAFMANILLIVLLSICALIIAAFDVIMLYRGSKMRESVEKTILLQIRNLKK